MSHSYSKSDQTPPSRSPTASAELKLYQAFIFAVPILFIFILLFSFYFFYLRRRRVDWSSLRMRTPLQTTHDISTIELGLKKEHREMLPIIVFKESFSVKDTQCLVCLEDYQAEDRLQQIPACGHTFHMDCIDLWLATHTTCPLCRLSLVASSSGAKASGEPPSDTAETSRRYLSTVENCEETSHPTGHHPCDEEEEEEEEEEEPACISSQELSPSRRSGDQRVLETSNEDEGRDSQFADRDRS